MTTDIMTSVFTALSAALPIPVTRAWPQGTPALPGCTFRLLSFKRGDDGTDSISILVLLRVLKPEDADAHSVYVQSNMLNIGLGIAEASDELDEASGFFIRSLTFEGKVPSSLISSNSGSGLRADFKFGSVHPLSPLPPPVSISVTPASRALVGGTPLSFSGATLPQLTLERFEPARLAFRCPYVPSYLALTMMRDAFLDGAAGSLRVYLRDPAAPSMLSVQVTDFHASALGVFANLLVLNL